VARREPARFRYYHRLSLRDAPAAARALEAVFPSCRRYLDVGGGTGTFAAELQRRGMNVTACERGLVGRLYARRQGVDARPFDLTREPAAMVDGPFDLAYSFEVAQQLPEPLGHRLVEFLSQQAPLVVFSSAQPGQGGTEPVNLRPKRYWIERFALAGMAYDEYISQTLAERFATEASPGTGSSIT
jgi:SAM-dependent methyltransferase